MGTRIIARACVLGFTCALAGCSAGEPPPASTGGAGRENEAAARKAYENDLQWLVRAYGDCQKQLVEKGECVIDTSDGMKPSSIVVTQGAIGTQDIRGALEAAAERAREFGDAVSRVARNGLCNVLAPYADAQHPYLWMGAQVGAGHGVSVNGNIDLVYDLRRRQAATFVSASVQVGTQTGVGASAYYGVAVGGCNDPNRPDGTSLLEAWTTPGCTVTGSVGLPARLLSVDMQVTASANGCIRGGTVGLGVGVSPVPLPVNVGVSRQIDGVGGPWNEGTAALSTIGHGNRTLECRARDADGSCAPGRSYVQFSSARDLAFHLAMQLGDKGATAAATVLALDELESRGLTIEQTCPSEVADERTRRTPPEAIQAVCNPAAVQQSNAQPNEPSGSAPPPPDLPPCHGRADDDYCGHEIGWSSPKAKVGCYNGLVKSIIECENGCEREGRYAYCN